MWSCPSVFLPVPDNLLKDLVDFTNMPHGAPRGHIRGTSLVPWGGSGGSGPARGQLGDLKFEGDLKNKDNLKNEDLS